MVELQRKTKLPKVQRLDFKLTKNQTALMERV